MADANAGREIGKPGKAPRAPKALRVGGDKPKVKKSARKGGDGGRAGRPASENPNKRVTLTGHGVDDMPTRTTSDPDDWAHGVTDRATGMTVPASKLRSMCNGRKPGVAREYHPSQLIGPVGREVAIDSMYDHAAAIAANLHNEGIDLGWQAMRHEDIRRLADATIPGGFRQRDRRWRKPDDDETPEERVLRQEANRMLRESRAR